MTYGIYFAVSSIFFIFTTIAFVIALRKTLINKFDENTTLLNKTKVSRNFNNQNQLTQGGIHSRTYTDIGQNKTELMVEGVFTENNSSKREIILKDIYKVEKLLGAGGMGRVYLCTKKDLGNQWAVKYIYSQYYDKLPEKDILIKLNHINLPKIIDVFNDSHGTYIVESYINGVGLDQKMSRNDPIDDETFILWANQLCDVLVYLHSIKPYPIIHRDLKPSNLIITDNNNLVLIDFGISKQKITAKDDISAGTRPYMAPEQLKYMSDERSDIYSYGVILYQLATKRSPNMSNYESILKATVAPKLAGIILKCIKENPKDRYLSALHLKADIESLKKIKNGEVLKYKFTKIASITIAVFMALITITTASFGFYKREEELLSVINITPEIIYLTEQQTGEVYIDKILPSGKQVTLDDDQILWEYSDINVAKIEGNRIVAVNAGETEILGRYGNKVLKMTVKVLKKQTDTNIKLKYNRYYNVEQYVGSGVRDINDGNLLEALMVEPSSIDIADDKTIYFVDSSNLRKIVDNTVRTIDIDLSYLQPKIIRTNKDTVYFISKEWQDFDGMNFISIVKLSNSNDSDSYKASIIYDLLAVEHELLDMSFDSEGNIYFLERNIYSEKSFIKVIDNNTGIVEDFHTVDYGVNSITIDRNDNIYISNSDDSVISKWNTEEMKFKYFVGIEGSKNFIDGINSMFYQPTKIKAYGNSLYVLDFNVLRRINIRDEKAFDCETIAGDISNDSAEYGKSFEAGFEYSNLRDFIILDNFDLIITDPPKSKIKKIKYEPDEAKA